MIWSKFNFLYKSNKHNIFLLYNTLTNVLIDLNDEKIRKIIFSLQEKIIDIETLKGYPIFNQLIESKIFVDSDEIEVLKIKQKTLRNRFSSSTLGLTILPSLACNFKCPYCFAKTTDNSFMSADIENRIFNYIENYKKIINNFTINLSWMGGEPLLNYKRIKALTNRILEIEIPIRAQLITNGFLLNKDKIKELMKLKINYVQITLDGLENEHDVTRIHKSKKSTFNKIVENISNFFDYYNNNNNVNLNIRVNLSKNENYVMKFLELYKYLRKLFPFENLHISPGFIENTVSSGHDMCCGFERSKIKDLYINLALVHGLEEFTGYPDNFNNECAVRSINTKVIGPSGEIYSCWDNIGNQSKIIGSILEDGTVNILNENLYIKYLIGGDYLSDEKCLRCIFLPICNGGCPEKRIQNSFEKTHHDCCCLQKGYLEEILDAHYEMKMKLIKNKLLI